MLKNILLSALALMWSNMTCALSVINTIDELSKSSKLTLEQREQGRQTLLLMVVHCELDEGCLLKQKAPLKEKFEKEKNPMYMGFINFLHEQREVLEKKDSHCQNDEKKATRKAYADCLQSRVQLESKPMPISTREKIDIVDDNQDVCLKNSMEKLAVEGNIYAQVHMVNFSQLMRDEKKMDYWYNLILKQENTRKYLEFQKCPELP